MRKFISLFLVLITLGFSVSAQEILVHTQSVHTQKVFYNKGTNEPLPIQNTNVGFGYKTANGLSIGAYINSYHSNSVYISQKYMFNDYLGVSATAATGYKKTSGRTVTAFPSAVIKLPVNETTTVNFILSPKFKDNIGVAHLVLSFKI